MQENTVRYKLDFSTFTMLYLRTSLIFLMNNLAFSFKGERKTYISYLGGCWQAE